MEVAGGEGGVGGEDAKDEENVDTGGGDPPQHPVWLEFPDPHGELVGRTDPNEVKVS